MFRRIATAWVPLLLLSVFCGKTAAQSEGSPAATLQVRSQLVVLDTVVTDRSGKLIRGLTKDDFAVYENGVKQTVRDFSFSDELTPIPAQAAKDRNGNDDWGISPLTMIVVDEMDTPFPELAYARDCVRRFLKAQPAELRSPTELIWLNDDGIHALTAFTRDRETLLAALGKQPPSLPSKLMRGAAAEQVAASFAALQQAALFSRGEAGKKELIWVGRSFPSIDPIGLTDYDRTLLTKAVRSTADLLLASRVTLYVIDPTITGSARDDDEAAQEVDTLQLVPGGNVKDPFASSFNINLFVAETGGRYFRGRNDLDQAIAASESRGLSYYTLTYVPTSPIESGAYRKIDVRLREPNLVAETKKGYYAEESAPVAPSSLEASLDEKELRFDLYEAAVTQMRYTGVGLHVLDCARETGSLASACHVQVDTGSLTFTPFNPSEERTTVIAVVASLNAKGRMIKDSVSRLTIAIPEEQMTRVKQGFNQMRLRTVVPEGTASIRVIVRDASGRIGTTDVPAAIIPKLTVSRFEMDTARKR